MSRIRDLTLQAKNGTYSKEEISAMQDEVSQRMAEIDRVSKSSKYSQLFLFGDAKLTESGITFQVGPNATDNDVVNADKGIFASIEFSEITGREPVEEVTEATEKDPIITTDGNKYNYRLATSEDGEDAITTLKVSKKGSDDFEYIDVVKLDEGKTAEELKEQNADYVGYGVAEKDKDNYEFKKVTTKAEEALDLTALEDADEFNQALIDLDAAIDNLTGRKSQIGSAQNRLSSALDALTTQYENLSSAKSVITDADIAAEASTFTQQQILQQVSTSLLAQANQAPSIALSLI